MADVARVHVVPDSRTHPKEVWGERGLWERLGVKRGQSIGLKAGQKVVPSRVTFTDSVVPRPQDERSTVRIHPSTLAQLSLPPAGFTCHLRHVDDKGDAQGDDQLEGYLHLGPFVGIFGVRGRGPFPFGGHELYFRSVAALSHRLGIPTYVFSPRDVDWNRGVVRGFQWHRVARDRGWRRQELPLPDVVYDRLLSRRVEGVPSVQAARQRLMALPGVHYFNPGYFNKWTTHQQLVRQPDLATYLPETRHFGSADELRQFLWRHRTVFLKPTGGSLGLGIVVIHRRGIGYRVTQHTSFGIFRRYFRTFPALIHHLRAYLGRRDYLMQQGVALARWRGRSFDIRVLMQKDAGGKWHRTKSYVRIAPPGTLTSNLSGGGTAGKLSTVLRATFGARRGQKLARQLISLATSLTPLIEEQVGGTIGELGLDLGVDWNGRAWIIEVNSKPYVQMTRGSGSPKAIRLSALRPLRWARYLAGFEPVGEDA